jgi:hypothetical protein
MKEISLGELPRCFFEPIRGWWIVDVKIRQAFTEGIRLFFWSIAFFYRHPSLVLLSLIPSAFRFIQMWNELRTPMWMEVIVEFSRVVLFFLVIARMSGSKLNAVFNQALWKRWNHSLKIELERNWPLTFIAQMAVFVIGLYWLMNSIIEWLLNPSIVTWLMAVFGAEPLHYDQMYTACQFFLKNMSVIPLSIVYILRMLGMGIHEPQSQ